MERSDPESTAAAGGTVDLERPADEDPTDQGPAIEELLTPGEVARMFGVDPKTVSRWADGGKLDALRTLGGHRRYRAEQVRALLDSAAQA